MFPLRLHRVPTPKWVRSGAVAGDAQHCSRHDVDPGRGSGSLREASVGSSSVPLVCSLPFGAPMPRRHGSSIIMGSAVSANIVSSYQNVIDTRPHCK